MAISIRTNIASLSTQRNLNSADTQVSKAFERLSTGLRINRPGDDSAGLSVAGALEIDARIAAQGGRNLNDGISLINVADAALVELQGIATRLQELAQQSANGAFSPKQRSALDAEAQSLAKEYNRIARTTEFNGRKLFDSDFGNLILQGGAGQQGVLLSNLGGAIGDGTFETATSGSFTGLGGTAWQVNADFNGDGNLDLALSVRDITATTNTINILYGDGAGNFSEEQIVTFADAGSLQEVQVGDFNGDGIADLAAANLGAGGVSILLGSESGTFSNEVRYGVSISQELTVGDFNGDGLSDVAVGGSGGSSIGVMLGQADGTLSSTQSFALATGTRSIETLDVNGDGNLDIIANQLSGDDIYTLLGDGQGGFGSAIVTNVGAATEATGLAGYDFNQDGFDDFVAVKGTTANIFLSQGDGTYSISALSAPTGVGSAAQIADYDGDGNVDLLTQDYFFGGSHLFTGNGDGTFNDGVQVLTDSFGRALRSGDFNNDGVADLIGTTSTGGIFYYQGSSEFGVSAIQPFSIDEQYKAIQALSQFKNLSTRLGEQRATLGAFQSRISNAVENLGSLEQEFVKARGVILDADVATETANLVRSQVLQSAGTAILAQANQSTAIVTQLLS